MKYLLLLLVALLVMVPACIIKETTSDNGDDDDEDEEDEIEMSEACVQLIGCSELVIPDMTSTYEDSYGEDSICWDDSDAALMCQDSCQGGLQDLLEMWEYPWDCEAGAVKNTNTIDTIDDVTWEWTVVDCPEIGSYCEGIDEWTLYTMFHGANSWKFTGERWGEHPTEGTVEYSSDIDCQMSTDNYLDFDCEGTEFENAWLDGTFSLDWATATAIWHYVTNESVLCDCDLEGEPVE